MDHKVRKCPLEEVDRLDTEYWKSQSPEKKLDTLQYLREIYYSTKNESRKRFQRVYRIIKQP